MATESQSRFPELPGLDCGLCGSRTCAEFAARVVGSPDLINRCTYLSWNVVSPSLPNTAVSASYPAVRPSEQACAPSCKTCTGTRPATGAAAPLWRDTLGREFDFYLEHFPEDPGPREIILPHNPVITRELEIEKGDVLIGRPLGMSCGCPITHCGVVMEVDRRTGVITWCVTGPLAPREKGFKDLGYYIAEGYEGLITDARCEIKIGMRYYFQPRMCMLQWRHSGLVNYLNRGADGLQVRVEGLWIG